MKNMIRLISGVVLLSFCIASCASQKDGLSFSEKEKALFESSDQDTVKIADAENEYEIIIIEPGFYNWLYSIARPEGYYSQNFMEIRNQFMVQEWNRRVILPTRYNPQLYMWVINYDPTIDYGYDVNYKLYNYFIYFQRKYNQRLGHYIPRI